MEIPGSGAQIQVPGAQHEAFVGEVEKSKKPENFREPKKCPPGTRESGFRAIFRPGADLSKNRRKKNHVADSAHPAHPPEMEAPPAGQTLGTVRMLSGLRSWTSTNSLKSVADG